MVSDSKSWQKLAYCKLFIDEEELPRIDMGNFNRLSENFVNELLHRLEKKLSKFDVVIINQQVLSGIHTKYFQNKLAKLISEYQNTIFLYDGRHVRDKYRNAWLKINDHEAMKLCNREIDSLEIVSRNDVLEAIKVVYNRLGKPVIVTRGAQGCMICADNRITEIPGIKVMGKIDPVGAGDSFLSGMSASLAGGASLEEAAQIGNFVAAVTIRKIGQTGTASQGEILKTGASPNYIT